MTDDQRARKRERDRKYREAHRDEIRERNFFYYVLNAERILEQKRAAYAAKKEEAKHAV